MAERTRDRADTSSAGRSLLDDLPIDRLKDELQDALEALAERAIDVTAGKVGDLTDRLTDVAGGSGLGGFGGKGAKGSMIAGALKGGLSGVKEKLGGGSGDGKALNATNIVEQIDVGVPVDVAYDQWTQFQDFPGFMSKVERVEQESDEKLSWKARIAWSHRSWDATIVDQVPDERIVWQSEGEKGYVDGAVTFHELAPNLTRILLVLEYYPQGLFERVGNLWRAQGRRARLELKHFRRHVMTSTILEQDELEGWRGEIHDSQVARGPEEEEGAEEDDYDSDEDEYDDEEYDEYDADEEPDEDEDEEDYEGDEEDEYEDSEDDEELEPEDEWDDEEYAEDDYADESDEDDEGVRRSRRAS